MFRGPAITIAPLSGWRGVHCVFDGLVTVPPVSLTPLTSAKEKASGFTEKLRTRQSPHPGSDTGTTMMDRIPKCRQASMSTRGSDSVSLDHCDICRRIAIPVRPVSPLIGSPTLLKGSPAVARQTTLSSRISPMATLVAPVACRARAASASRMRSSFSAALSAGGD